MIKLASVDSLNQILRSFLVSETHADNTDVD
jgi:hypothetical protein